MIYAVGCGTRCRMTCMRISSVRLGLLSVGLVVALVACSGIASPVAPPAVANGGSADQRWVSSNVYAYVDDPYGNFVDAFDRRGKLLGKVTTDLNGPQGLYVDASRNLWIANTSGNDVLVFPPGSSTPSRTLDDAGALPSDVVLGNDGTAYVANILDQSGYGSIEVYPPGQNEPARAIRDPNAAENLFITIDTHGNLFVTVARLPVKGRDIGRVDEYVGAQQSGLKRLAMKLGAPGGIHVFHSRLLICDTTEQTVREYTEAGRPTGRVLVTGGSWGGFDVNSTGTVLLGADQTYLEGLARRFPGETIRHVYRDSAFQYPVGAAYASGQGDR
jgi:hypothetical protein